jgi:glycosyltransferase involved in cell wall biosynthesis
MNLPQEVAQMHVLVDGTAFENATQRGIQRYFCELLPRLGNSVAIDMMLRGPVLGEVPSCCHPLRVHRPWAQARNPVLRRIGRHLPERGAQRLHNGHQLFHSTFYTAPPVEGLPEVVTVHDMILERFAHLFSNYVDETVALKRRCIEAARVCIAASQATADELVAFYPQVTRRVMVIHHGAEHLTPRVRGPVVEPQNLPPGPYVLFVGERGGYKNFRTLLDAVAGLGWPAGLSLVVVGPRWGEAEVLLLRRLGLADRVIHAGRVLDAQLAGWYRRAAALVVPSLAEGFGFPALEAQSFGTPVLCSRVPIFTEVLGESAEYFDPRLAESIQEAAVRALDPAWHARLSAAGFANLRRFQWSRCAELTLQAYQKALA